MTRWRVLLLIAIATLVPALTVAVVLADLPEESRRLLVESLGDRALVLGLGLVVLVAGIGSVAWSTWRSELRQDTSQAADIDVITTANPAHRLAGDTAVQRSVNRLAEAHAGAEDRLTTQLSAAHAELRRERDALLAVLAGLDVPLGVVDERGRVLLVNPAARRALGTRIAAGRSIFSVLAADDLIPLLTDALDGGRPRAVVAGRSLRLVRITGPDEPPMVLMLAEPAPVPVAAGSPASVPADADARLPAGPEVALSTDLARPSRPMPDRERWLDTPLDHIVFTVLDCETTGLHSGGGDRLVAIGAVRVDGTRVCGEDTFDALINPGRHIPSSSTAFHGITDEMVAGAPGAPEAVADLADYAADSVLVGHHLSFDLGFLAAPASQAGISLEPLFLDTMLLSAVLDPDPDARHGLDTLCARMGVEVIGRHTALGDALATAEVLVRMIPLLAERGVRTLGEALSASAATDLAGRLSRTEG